MISDLLGCGYFIHSVERLLSSFFIKEKSVGVFIKDVVLEWNSPETCPWASISL